MKSIVVPVDVIVSVYWTQDEQEAKKRAENAVLQAIFEYEEKRSDTNNRSVTMRIAEKPLKTNERRG